MIRAARALTRRVTDAVGILQRASSDIPARHAQVLDGLVSAGLTTLPLETLRSASQGRLNLAPLLAAGYTTVGQLPDEATLTKLPGIGTTSARAIRAAADTVRADLAEETRFRIELDPSNTAATALLQALERYDLLRRESAGLTDQLHDLVVQLPAELATARPAANPVRWLFTGGQHRQAALAAADRLASVLGQAEQSRLDERIDRLSRAAAQPVGDPWPSFERRASDYYALLSEFVATGVPSDAVQGFLTDDVVADVQAQELDDRLRNVDLRGYQSFGARFALARRRVILGDEMGLGKTIQALAAACHLRTFDGGPILVVCPASVMANWEREIERRTLLPALTLHGPDRQDEVTQWLAEGPIGITTYDTLRRLELPHDLRLTALIVDEAHFAKNPDTARSRAVRRLAGSADHVWFLTGTPMENTVDEFARLIRYLQSDIVPAEGMPSGSVAFRRRVSPVYLRRNAVDVLVELPERQEIDEWVYLTPDDRRRYRTAVGTGNLMAIRQAGFGPGECAKLERLAELLTEAAANGLKVVVYSFFLDVIDRAGTAVNGPGEGSPVRGLPSPPADIDREPVASGDVAVAASDHVAGSAGEPPPSQPASGIAVFGPLTGAVAATRRQDVVDAFTAHPGPAVLLAQIQAAGIGLNLQAASVVVLCEPQLTPSSEEQAIARAHRIGQVRPVQVHRLLAVDTVDERITELLAGKRADFDAYARRSDLAEAAHAAVDVTFGDLAKRLVAEEQSRQLR